VSDSAKLITGLRQAWRDEMASARNYRALAEREPNPQRNSILIRLAEAEDKHAANWETRLKELGTDPGTYRESPKERARRWLIVQRGTEDAVLKLEQFEKDADALYDDLLKVCTEKIARRSKPLSAKRSNTRTSSAKLAVRAFRFSAGSTGCCIARSGTLPAVAGSGRRFTERTTVSARHSVSSAVWPAEQT
jgi:rubrerythrin